MPTVELITILPKKMPHIHVSHFVLTSVSTNVKRMVRTIGSEHQGQNSISYPDQSLGFTCIFYIRYARNLCFFEKGFRPKRQEEFGFIDDNLSYKTFW